MDREEEWRDFLDSGLDAVEWGERKRQREHDAGVEAWFDSGFEEPEVQGPPTLLEYMKRLIMRLRAHEVDELFTYWKTNWKWMASMRDEPS